MLSHRSLEEAARTVGISPRDSPPAAAGRGVRGGWRRGLGRWSEQDFLDRVYQYKEYAEKGSPQVGPESFTLMPWLNFAQLKPEDLKAIYAFLRTQRPIYHVVVSHPVWQGVIGVVDELRRIRTAG